MGARSFWLCGARWRREALWVVTHSTRVVLPPWSALPGLPLEALVPLLARIDGLDREVHAAVGARNDHPILRPLGEALERRFRPHDRATRNAWRRWIEPVPEPLRSVVRSLPRAQARALVVAGAIPAFADLLVANRGLAFALLLTERLDTPAAVRRFARLMTWRQRRLLARLLGVDAVPRCGLRIMQRMDLRGFEPSSALGVLARHLGEERRRALLCQMRTLNETTLHLLAEEHAELCSPGLLEAAADDATVAAQLLSLLATVDGLAAADGFDLPVPRGGFRSVRLLAAALQRANDRCLERMHSVATADFPPPPFAGCASIVPIRTGIELRLESEEMEHCASRRHHPGAVAGWACFYRVLEPARATLGLFRSSTSVAHAAEEGHWWHFEVRGPGNTEIAPEVVTRILLTLLATENVGGAVIASSLQSRASAAREGI